MRQERWRIEVAEITGDRELLEAALAANGFELEGNRLYGSLFESFDSASDVYAAGDALSRLVNRLSELKPDIGMTFRLGSVREMTPDGEKIASVTANISASLAIKFAVRADLTDGSLTKEERAKLEREKRIDRASTFLRAARADVDVLVVLQLLDGEPTTMELGHVVDIIQDNMSGDMATLAPKNQLTRFERSINHPDIFGLSARHARTKVEPPPNPMSMQEATKFVRELSERWIAKM